MARRHVFNYRVFPGTVETFAGKLLVMLGTEPCQVELCLTREEADAFAKAILKEVEAMPRHREGTAADLGLEVLP